MVHLLVVDPKRPLPVVFYKSPNGGEPVRKWLKGLPKEYRKKIGIDIKTAQYGWPIGMPLIRKIANQLWEIRTRHQNAISRVFITEHERVFYLLHGFIKKTQKAPANEIKIAKERLAKLIDE